MLFFISPAYRVPPISTSFLPKWMTTKVPLRVPCRDGIRLEIGRVEHGEAGPELRQLRRHGPDEHVAHEEGVPRVRRHEPDRNPVGGIRAGEEVLDEDLVGIEVAPHVLVQPLEGRRLQPGILLPPDPVGAARLLDDELVLGRASGVRGGEGAEGAAIGQGPLATGNSALDQGGGGEIGVDPDGEQPVFYQGQTLTRGRGRLGHNSHAPSSAEEGLERSAWVASVATG